MSAKRKVSVRTSVVTSEPPEITDEWIAGAGLYSGEKLVLSLRLPPEVIANWKATGPGWQTRMAEVLEKSTPKSRRSSG